MKAAVLTHWRTSSAGVIVIFIAVFQQVTGVHIPGFQLDVGPAIAAGIGLLMAKDGAQP